MTAHYIRLELFGGLRIHHGRETIVRLPTRKTGALLARLALYPGRVHPREELMDILWPDADADAARQNLRQTLHYLRRALGGPEFLNRLDNSAICIPIECVSTDVADFEEAVRLASDASSDGERFQLLSHAAEVYRGELLAGYYEDWIESDRSRFEARYLAVLDELHEVCLRLNRVQDALDWGHRRLERDPLNEDSHCMLMRTFAAAGQPAALRKQVDEMTDLFNKELGVAPSRDTLNLAEQLIDQANHNAARLQHELALHTSRSRRSSRLVLTTGVAAGLVLALGLGVPLSRSHKTGAAATSTTDPRIAGLAAIRPGSYASGSESANRSSRRHAETCVQLAEEAWSSWYGPDEERWVNQLAAANEDIDTALTWLIFHDPAKAVKMSGALARYWYRGIL